MNIHKFCKQIVVIHHWFIKKKSVYKKIFFYKLKEVTQVVFFDNNKI